MTATKTPKQAIHGVLLLDKPLGFSSNKAMQKVRWLFQAAKVGHTGNLDPLATGLLPLCFGDATKFAQRLLDADKGYIATIKLGATTLTGDLEGEILTTAPVHVDQAQLEAVLRHFTGPVAQCPPMHSALKFQGKALYEYARQGISVERAARQIHIHQLTLLDWQDDLLRVDVRCSKGTYIRVLAEDIGAYLGCGAHLAGLRRTHTAGFHLRDTLTLEALEALDPVSRHARLLPVDVLLPDLPVCTLSTPEQVRYFCQGRAVQLGENHGIMPDLRVYAASGMLLGLGEIRADHCLYPKRVLAAQAR
jgi:tRNA pseudouridine55 synthase